MNRLGAVLTAVALLVSIGCAGDGDSSAPPTTEAETTTTVTTAREFVDLSSRASENLVVVPSELEPGQRFHLDHLPPDWPRGAVIYLSPAWDVGTRVYGLGSVAVSSGLAQRLDDPTPWTIPSIAVSSPDGDDFVLPDDIEPGAWLGCYDGGTCFQILVRDTR